LSAPRLALVTGASRGIGAAIAEELAGAGCAVLLNYRADAEGAATIKSRIESRGGRATLLPFDVTDAPAVTAALGPWTAEDADPEDAAIDIVVNNAGVLHDGPFPAMTASAWESVTRTTLDGFFNVTRPLVMRLVQRRWGRIINIASLAGQIGHRGQVNYSAAKAGLIGATRSLAQELAKRHVTVNAVAPGLIDTDMLAGLPRDQLTQQIPMRRLGSAGEVAKLVGFLAGEHAGYITGQVIGINGGLG
jgi:3-oxoacyl-[acyl-carrier protein] reductase